MVRTRWFLPTIWVAFFVSGVAGLIYEVVWARYLDLVLGGTAYAHVMVLSAYMGGLALGAWFFGRLTDRLSEPLVVYTYLELAIGLYGLIFPILFSIGSDFYLLLAHPLGTTGPGGVLNKFIISALMLGPSTFLMGGTLPLLTRAVTSLPDRVGRGVAGLYFINSLGAVCGVLLGGFALIPGLGMSATLTVAATLNIAVGIIVLSAWRYGWLVKTAADDEDGTSSPGVQEGAGGLEIAREFRGVDSNMLNRWALVAVWGAGISGLVVMVYEVSWIRLLSTILGSSTYSFTLMLAAFITGIALGSLIARWLSRFEYPFLFFGISQLLIGASLLLALPLYSGLPVSFLGLQSIIARTESGYPVHELLKYLYCLGIMLPPTLASGAALPLATDVAARLVRRIGQPVGRIFAVNTMGTIIGALLGGLVLLPWLGVKLTLEAGIVVNVVFGLWVLSLNPAVRAGWMRGLMAGGAALFLLYVFAVPSWDLRAFAAGVFREKLGAGSVREQFQQTIDRLQVNFYEEDVNGTVAVLQHGTDFSLVVNGKADASTHLNDKLTQTMIAAIPAMMVPRAESALIIGLGSGQTAGHLLEYPLKRVEVVEISPGVVKASRYFDHISGRPLSDPRTILVMQDAKTYLLTRPDVRYDLILSEPSNPWIKGIGGLFSIEYFKTLQESLEPGGVVAQWVQIYELTDETLRCVLLTFSEVFPYVTLWGMSSSDLLLVGSQEPVTWDFEAAAGVIERPGVSEDLSDIYIRSLFTLLNRQLMSPIRMAEATSLGGRLNTDNFPYLEYRAPRDFFLDQQAALHMSFDERNRNLPNTDLVLKDYLDGRAPTAGELADLVYYLRNAGGLLPRLHASAAAAWVQLEPDEPSAIEAALHTGVIAQMAAVEEAIRLLDQNRGNLIQVKTSAETLIEVYSRLNSAVFSAQDLAEALLVYLPEAVRFSEEDRAYYLYLLGQVEYDKGDYESSIETLQEALREVRDREELDGRVPTDHVMIYLGRAFLELKRYDEARMVFRDAFRLNPANSVAAFYLAELNPETTSGRYIPISGLLRRP